MDQIVKRLTVDDLYKIKLRYMDQIQQMETLDKEIGDNLGIINGFHPYRLDWRFEDCAGKRREELYIDRILWTYLVRLNFLEKYMLCSEYAKMMTEINEFRTPVFNPENAIGWLENLRSMIYENVRLMCKRVYDEIISAYYYTGSGYNKTKKKRNNAGVDHSFIICTGDYHMLFSYWPAGPTITDDLEKVCYILDGKSLPEKTVKIMAQIDKSKTVECPYFSVNFCKNGNTHYRLTDETWVKLNKIGPDGNLIGENIRIKVFE